MDTEYDIDTLAGILAQIVHFARDDYNSQQSETEIPHEVLWNVAYTCACFTAQHTEQGGEGVDTEHAFNVLLLDKDISYAERVRCAHKLVEMFGGQP